MWQLLVSMLPAAGGCHEEEEDEILMYIAYLLDIYSLYNYD